MQGLMFRLNQEASSLPRSELFALAAFNAFASCLNCYCVALAQAVPVSFRSLLFAISTGILSVWLFNKAEAKAIPLPAKLKG